MVNSSYFNRKPPAPSALKRFFDQRVVPMAIDGAACLDIGFANAGRQVRRNPMLGVGVAVGVGILVAAALQPRRPRSVR
jgi:hypothetical protein